MLSHALPTKVVLVIGEHVCKQAAVLVGRSGCVVLLFELIIGAKWRASPLCDVDGNLVYL